MGNVALQRVAVMAELVEVHPFVGPAKQVFVGHGEIEAVEGDAQGLGPKPAVDVRMHALLVARHGLLVLFVADALFQFHHQRAVVLGHPSVCCVDHEDASALGVPVIVNEHVVEGAVRMLCAHANGKSVNAVVEHAFADVEGGFLFGDGIEQGTEAHVGSRPSGVAEPQRAAADERHAQHQGSKDAEERHARGLHGRQFAALGEVAHGHDGGDEDGEREREIDQTRGREDHQFENHPEIEAFADEVVGVHPQELHVQDEQRHGQGDGEGAEKGTKHEPRHPHVAKILVRSRVPWRENHRIHAFHTNSMLEPGRHNGRWNAPFKLFHAHPRGRRLCAGSRDGVQGECPR